jgi:hypothetical protein
MAHLTEQLRRGLLARSLSPADTIAAVEHVRGCESCRNDLVALRSEKAGSVEDQILPVAPSEQHPSDDVLAAYTDNDLMPLQKGSVEEHLIKCALCRETIADLADFRSELQELPSRNYAPELLQRRGHNRYQSPNFQAIRDRVAEWFANPLVLAGAVAAALVIITGVVSTGLFYRSPAPSQLAVDSIQDGSLTFNVSADGQLTPLSATLSREAVTVLATSILELAHAQLQAPDLMRGLSETPAVTTRAPSETKLPSGEYFFSRKIFGAVVALPRATPDPDVQPNGIVIRDTIPVLSWSAGSDSSKSQTLTVRDCATNQTVLETQLSGDKHSFTIPGSLRPGGFYVWEVTEPPTGGSIPGKSVTGRFKIISESDLQSLASEAAQSSHLLKSFLLARAGLFAEADTELTKLADSNPKSPTIVSALNYVRELEGM